MFPARIGRLPSCDLWLVKMQLVCEIASPLNFLARHARNTAQYDSENEYVLRTYFQ